MRHIARGLSTGDTLEKEVPEHIWGFADREFCDDWRIVPRYNQQFSCAPTMG